MPFADGALLAWSSVFAAGIESGYASLGLTQAAADQYRALHDDYAAKLALCQDPATRTHVAVVNKDSARSLLRQRATFLNRIIQGQMSVTAGQKAALGLTVYNLEPTPIPPPADKPQLSVASVDGRMVTLRIRNILSPDSRARPLGVAGAMVYSFVGENPTEDVADWKYEGSTTRTTFLVAFPTTVAAGSTVWFSAAWFNPRQETGPAAEKVSTTLGGGLSQAQAA